MDTGGAGGNTLDAAYDQGGGGSGRTITADSNAVQILGTALGGDDLLDIDHTASGTLTANTTNIAIVDASRTHTAASSITDDFDVLAISRTNISNNGSATLTANGSVLKLEDIGTQTLGTLNDNTILLELVADADQGDGDAIDVRQGAEANQRWSIDKAGLMSWGPGGGTAVDTTLSRTGVGILDLTDILDVNTGLRVAGTATTGNYLRGNGTNFVDAGLTLVDADNQGTTTTLLHGNAGGAVSFGAVVTADITDSQITLAKMADIKEFSIIGKDTAGAGAPLNLDETDIPTEAAPVSGDFLFGWDAAGLMVKYDVGTLPSAGANTLNAAYDEGGAGVGRTITADSNAVQILGTALGGDDLLDVDHTASGTLTANSTNIAVVDSSRTHTAATSVTDDFDVVSISRTNISNNGSATLTANGSVLKLEDIGTQTLGTLNDNTILLELVCDADQGDGDIIDIRQGAEANQRWSIDKTGLMSWGPGAGTVVDTTLSRTGVGILDLTDILDVNTGFRIAGGAVAGEYLRGNAANFVSSVILDTDLPANVVLDDESNTWSTGTQDFTAATSTIFTDGAGLEIRDNVTPTKRVQFQLSAITAAAPP